MLSLSATAATVDPKITMPAVSVPETVTVSNSSSQDTPNTYLAYLVSFVNGGGSDINQVRLDGGITVTGGLTAALIDSVSTVLPGGCTLAATSDSFSCSFGTQKPGWRVDFPVIVKVPEYKQTFGLNESITLTLNSSFREGKSGTASPSSLGTLQTVAVTPVAQESPSSMKSIVLLKNEENLFFTGGKGVPKATNAGDVYTTLVNFAPLLTGPIFSRVEITEAEFVEAFFGTCSGGGHFKKCHSTLLRAPDVDYEGTTKYLTETIRVHPDNFVKNAKMSTVIWEYTPTDANGVALPGVDPTIVGMCGSLTTPRSDGIPCQTGPVVCYKKSTPGWTPELDGVCEWRFINLRNGFQRGY
jgi:hypothetical protein